MKMERNLVFTAGIMLASFFACLAGRTDDLHYFAEGYVTYDDGIAAEGVAVSDGFRVAVTDGEGKYRLATSPDTRYIYFSYPEDARITFNENGLPDFFIRYVPSVTRYDFMMERGEYEEEFSLFALADPQAHSRVVKGQNTLQVDRFHNESVQAVNAHIATKKIPCYAVTLGDIVYSEGTRNTVGDMPLMRKYMSEMDMPVFQTMGNHDFTYFHSSCPISADPLSSTANLHAQRAFEDAFGPVNYSFNRGDVHIVCMRDIVYDSNVNAGKYHGGFSPAQIMWLKSDLDAVPKDKTVILCLHIPLVGTFSREGSNTDVVVALLRQFKDAHIFSGHTHYMRNLTSEETPMGVYEHIHAAVSGAWWWSDYNGDGSPNGFGVYDFRGSSMVNGYFVGVNGGNDYRSNQMRLYRGDEVTGGEYEYFQWNEGADVLLANVFNSDSNWKLEVYEDGVLSGEMTRMPASNARPEYVEGVVTTVPSGSTKDWWVIGYHVGVVGRGHGSGGRNNYLNSGFHMYSYRLKSPASSVRVVATDTFGNTYECSEITPGREYGR